MKKILEFNQRNLNNNPALYDLNQYQSISSNQIIEMIHKYQLPDILKKEEIKKNLNLNEINNHIQKGIVIQKTNLKGFPTKIIFKNENYPTFDMNQETELHINTPILILHESFDQKYYFVLSEIYYGWVLKKDIAFIDNFKRSDNFCVIVDSFININNIIFDMGVCLPCIKNDRDFIICEYPTKDCDGYVKYEQIQLNKDQVFRGYLEFNKENVITQAYKYEKTPYSWGGKDKEGIDCSGFVSNVLSVFGFKLPRNTDDQELCFENVMDVEKMSNNEKMKILEELSLAILYQPGHVMLYIGNLTMIHANATTMNVYIEKIHENTKNLFKINKIVPLEMMCTQNPGHVKF